MGEEKLWRQTNTFSSRAGGLKGKPKEAFDILNDVPGYLRWWPEVYLGVENPALGDRDGVGKTYALLTRGKLPYRLRWHARIIAQTAAKQPLD